MSNNVFHIHNVTHVLVDTETVGLDSGNGYTVRRVNIHSVDFRGNTEILRVTLYGVTGEHNVPGVPFEFLQEEDAQ